MEKVRITAIGCGGFMRYRLKNLMQIPEVEIVALVDPDASQLDRTRQAYPELRETPSFPDYREALKVESDAVTIATPHTQHAQQIIDCLDSGRHVIVEKPMVTNVEDAHRVIAARDRSGLPSSSRPTVRSEKPGSFVHEGKKSPKAGIRW